VNPRNRVAVVGAGITGLVAARSLAAMGFEAVLLEAQDHVGGKIRTRVVDGVTVEEGPDAFLPRDDRPLQICREIGLGSDLVPPAEFGALIYIDGTLKPLPRDTVLGFPTSLRSLARSRLVGPFGVARAALDLVLPGRLSGGDVSVKQLADRRFGPRVTSRLIDPLMAGTRAGRLDTMSLAAAAPEVDRAARRGSSVMRNLKMPSSYAAYGPTAKGPLFHAPRSGMGALTDHLRADLGDATLRTGVRVEELTTGGVNRLSLSTGETIEADAVILAVPSYVASEIVRSIDADIADGMRSIAHSSSAVVNLVFGRDSIAPPEYGSGVLVPSSEESVLTACTWSDRKWPQHASANRRAVRAFVGRADRHPALDLSDEDLVEDVVEDLSRLTPVSSDPHAWNVTRWERGMPMYEVGHVQRVASLRAGLAPKGICLAGASYRGSGIPDCIRQADEAVAEVAGFLRS
jgi:oxygen-dependent protoporphyrinogen oxidase